MYLISSTTKNNLINDDKMWFSNSTNGKFTLALINYKVTEHYQSMYRFKRVCVLPHDFR